jgi:hypothetical protein
MMRRFFGVCAMILALTFAMPAHADENQEQITQYRTMLTEQDALDTKGVAAQDRELAAKWLQEAEVLLANGDSDAADKRLRRVEFAIDLIRAMVASAEIRTAAEAQEAAAFKGPEITEQLQTEVEGLRQKRTELQQELQRLQ